MPLQLSSAIKYTQIKLFSDGCVCNSAYACVYFENVVLYVRSCLINKMQLNFELGNAMWWHRQNEIERLSTHRKPCRLRLFSYHDNMILINKIRFLRLSSLLFILQSVEFAPNPIHPANMWRTTSLYTNTQIFYGIFSSSFNWMFVSNRNEST